MCISWPLDMPLARRTSFAWASDFFGPVLHSTTALRYLCPAQLSSCQLHFPFLPSPLPLPAVDRHSILSCLLIHHQASPLHLHLSFVLLRNNNNNSPDKHIRNIYCYFNSIQHPQHLHRLLLLLDRTIAISQPLSLALFSYLLSTLTTSTPPSSPPITC